MADDIFRFRNFPVYKEVRIYRKDLKRIAKKKFPVEEKYCLTFQLRRALNSVLLNIAEGTDRISDVDFSKFLNISLTSLNEVISCLDIALDDEYITENDHKLYSIRGQDIYKQLKALTSKIRKDGKNTKSSRKNKKGLTVI